MVRVSVTEVICKYMVCILNILKKNQKIIGHLNYSGFMRDEHAYINGFKIPGGSYATVFQYSATVKILIYWNYYSVSNCFVSSNQVTKLIDTASMYFIW